MTAARRLPGLVVLAILALAPMRDARASPSRWSADPARSRIVVHVFKKGLFSGLAHDHHFVAGTFRVTATIDEAAPSAGPFEVIVAAGSLRDQQPDLSDDDRAKVDAQAAGEDVLDASRFPEIRLVPAEVPAGLRAAGAGGLEGQLAGTLTLHGQQRPVSVAVRAARDGDGWRARGSTRFRQSDFGIEPYSGFLGAIAVQDEVLVEFDLRLEAIP
jgi:polyisoprenoid-binding protein YceI